MSVPSFEFLAFALVGALLFNLAGAGIIGRLVMLALNLAFFATFLHQGNALQIALSAAPYAAFLLAGYLGVVSLRARPSRLLLVACILVILAAFFWMKRYAFVPEAFSLSRFYVTIGISYVFFRVLHLIIDVGQGAIEEKISPISYLNYTLNFTALVSGPIQFYKDFKAAEAERPPLTIFALARAAERIVAGLFKVMILSSVLNLWQDAMIAALPAETSVLMRVLLVAGIGAIYPLFLYANFSGYTDFVIGAARLFRLKLPENFNDPFASENFISFWSRWHITLSTWLKTYVYTPLLMALMRRQPGATFEPWFAVLAYFVTFFLVGAWHGQTSEFLFFGVLQGAGVAGNKLWQIVMQSSLSKKRYRALAANPLYRAASRGLTFTYFAFTLLWFWSTWSQIDGLAYAEGLSGFIIAWGFVFVTATIVLSALVWTQERLAKVKFAGDPVLSSRYVRTVCVTAMAVITVAVAVLMSGPAPDIVYRNF